MAHDSTTATCQCGQTVITLSGPLIQTATCLCESCRTAAQGFERDLGAPPTVNAEGGVEYCLYRKDQVTITQGAPHLREYRLKPESPTRRVVASCCNSPMFADFTRGHWLSINRQRLPPPAPPPQLRVMARDKRSDVVLSDAIPNSAGMSPRLMIKLLAAWAAMGFRRPKIVW
jgi:hypothetical protein